MTFFKWCLLVMILVVCLGGLAFMLLALADPLLRILKAMSRNRSDLNPQTSQGRWRLVGIGWFAMAAVLVYLCTSSTAAGGVLFFVLAFLPGIAGMRSFARAKRFDACAAAQIQEEDKRPAVVYLRSFDADRRSAGRIGIAGFHLNTEEGELAEIVKPIGPFVTIGRPGEELPWFGAARVYVGEGSWHKRVRDLLKSAPLVILRAGLTPGLTWEVGECAKWVKPQRLLVLIPLRHRDYDKFCRKAADLFPCGLPEYRGRYIGATSLRAVLYFDDDWTPHLDPVLKEGYASWFLDKVSGDSDVLTKEKSDLRKILENALEPVLRRSLYNRC